MSDNKILGVILAGGKARRMGGGDKTLIEVVGQSLLQHVIDRQNQGLDHLIINAHGDPARFAQFNLPVVPDSIEGHLGPLAGVLTAMDYAAEHVPECTWVLSLPGDTPFMPKALGPVLLDAIQGAGGELACAQSAGRNHPVVGLWPVRLRADLAAALNGGMRKIDRWTANYSLIAVPFSDQPFDPFFNINTPEDHAQAESIAATLT